MKTLLTLLLGLGLLVPNLGGSTTEAFTASDDHLVSRFYRIDPDRFVRNLKKSVSLLEGESNQHLLVRFFKENHVELKKPAKVLLDEERSILSLTTTKADHDKIERLLAEKRLVNKVK